MKYRGGAPCVLIADLEFAWEIGVWLEVASLKLTVAFQGSSSALSDKGSSSRKEVVGVSKLSADAIRIRMRNTIRAAHALHHPNLMLFN